MREFTTAVTEVEQDNEAEAKIAVLVAKYVGEGMEQAEAEDKARAEVEGYVQFKIDGRVLRAYAPTDGQLAFMMAALGRGQTQDSRFASMINIMLGTLRDDDQDYLESRLLSNDPKKRLPVKQVEEIFEYLASEWFARPTQ